MEPEKTWRTESFTLTDQGTREYQQDAALAETEGGLAAAVLCDGMGGLNGGETASREAIRQFMRDLKDFWPVQSFPDYFESEAVRLDRLIFNLADEEGKRLQAGTTIVTAIVEDNQLFWMSVGDSRLYLIREGSLRRLTRDHNYKEMLKEKLVAGQIDMELYNLEISRGEALTSYLGLGGIPLIDRNTDAFELKNEDILLLCSDGLYKTLSEEQIQALVVESGGNISIAGTRLLQHSRRLGVRGRDNTTVILLKVKGPDMEMTAGR